MPGTPKILVHGGAGGWKNIDEAPVLEGVRASAKAGWEVLCAGGSALDAVEAAIDASGRAASGRAIEDDADLGAVVSGIVVERIVSAATDEVAGDLTALGKLERVVLAAAGEVLEAGEEHAEIDIVVGDQLVLGVPQRIGDTALIEPVTEQVQHMSGCHAGGDPLRHSGPQISKKMQKGKIPRRPRTRPPRFPLTGSQYGYKYC